uniref:Uncharacterized protein n=1 Tax=Anguilla anguilla TaxID=7936 RepID=A0A0E9WX07_ANGAN
MCHFSSGEKRTATGSLLQTPPFYGNAHRACLTNPCDHLWLLGFVKPANAKKPWVCSASFVVCQHDLHKRHSRMTCSGSLL